MSRRKLVAKRTIPVPERLNENNNIQTYLSQYKLSDIPNPSDDSDFEDTSYETDLLYEQEKKLNLQIEAEEKRKLEKERETNAKMYYKKQKNNPQSIFNIQGIHFEHYTHNFINFIFSPSAFSHKYICAHRKYHVSLKYGTSRWHLKQLHVPNRSKLIQIFDRFLVTDDNLIETLYQIYQSLVKCTYDQINIRKEKYQKYLNHEEVELNSDDERLFFTPEERRKRKADIMKIWNRMLPPD